MNTQIDPKKIAQLLTKSTYELDEATLSALTKARREALRVKPKHAPAFVLTTGHWTGSLVPHSAMQWLGVGFLAALLVVAGTSAWQHAETQQNIDLDVAILTDEMPIDVFVN